MAAFLARRCRPKHLLSTSIYSSTSSSSTAATDPYCYSIRSSSSSSSSSPLSHQNMVMDHIHGTPRPFPAPAPAFRLQLHLPSRAPSTPIPVPPNCSLSLASSFLKPKPYSSPAGEEQQDPSTNESPYPSQNPNFKHQEIEGPTVERDLSALANETRHVVDTTTRTAYALSKALAGLALLHLALGASACFFSFVSAPSSAQVESLHLHQQQLLLLLGGSSCVAGFAFTLCLALMLRQSLKPIVFFRKMEEQGRLQILTLTLQLSKSLNLFFLRARTVSFFCAAGLSLPLLFALLSFSPSP